MKICKTCKIEKQMEQFSVNRAARDGRVNSCKPCEVKRVAAWTAANPKKVKEWENKNRTANLRATMEPNTPRQCRKCLIVKTIADFSANPRSKDNVRRICNECTSSHMAIKYLENPEAQRAKTAKWRAENPVEAAILAKEYRDEHKDRLNENRRLHRLKNIEREKERDREYTKNNRAKVYAKNARRRAAETQATPKWLTLIQQAQILEFYELAQARKMQTGINFEVDHIVPLLGKTVRGLHVPWNLQLLTETQNISKKNKLIERSA